MKKQLCYKISFQILLLIWIVDIGHQRQVLNSKILCSDVNMEYHFWFFLIYWHLPIIIIIFKYLLIQYECMYVLYKSRWGINCWVSNFGWSLEKVKRTLQVLLWGYLGNNIYINSPVSYYFYIDTKVLILFYPHLLL